MDHIVGVSEMKTSKKLEDGLITFSLGSCVGLSLYDPVAKVGGLVHCMLPLSKLNEEKAKENPCMFTDTGVIALLQSMIRMGADPRKLVAKVAGGAAPLDAGGTFKIGQRNYVVLRKTLWKNDILLAAVDVGGTKARTMKLSMATGETTIKSNGREVEL